MLCAEAEKSILHVLSSRWLWSRCKFFFKKAKKLLLGIKSELLFSFPVQMSRRAFQFLLLVLLTVVVTDEVHGIYSFKRAPNQFRKRVAQTPLMIFAWVREQSFVAEKMYDYSCNKFEENQNRRCLLTTIYCWFACVVVIFENKKLPILLSF